MDTVVHFVFPLLVLLGARIHLKHGIEYALGLAALSVLLDVDHFIFVPRGTFHNFIVVLILPIVAIFLAFKYEKKGIKWKAMSVASFIFLTGHVLLDLFDNLGVRFLYPFSMEFYSFKNWAIGTTISTGQTAYILTPAGISITIFFAMATLVYFLEDVVKLMQKHHEKLKDALFEETKNIEKDIKEEL